MRKLLYKKKKKNPAIFVYLAPISFCQPGLVWTMCVCALEVEDLPSIEQHCLPFKNAPLFLANGLGGLVRHSLIQFSDPGLRK